MARNLTEVSTFTTPITVPENGEPARRETEDPPLQALANRTKFLDDARAAHDGRITAVEAWDADSRLDVIEPRIVSDEWTYPSPKARTRILHAVAGVQATEFSTGDRQWTFAVVGTAPNQGYELRSRQNRARLVFPLQWYVPPDSTITRIRALVQPATSRPAMTSTPGDQGRMYAGFFSAAISFNAGGSISYTGPQQASEDDGTLSLQILDTGVFSYAVTNKSGANLIYSIVATDNGGTLSDQVFAVEISYTDVGPRNL